MIAGCIAVGSLAVAGCGGGSSSSSGASGAALSQSKFVSQANAICKDYNNKIVALPRPTDTASVLKVGAAEIRLFLKTYPKYAALKPPSNLQSEYSQWLSSLKASVRVSRQLGAAVRAGDAAKVQALRALAEAKGKEHTALETKLGLTECTKVVQAQG